MVCCKGEELSAWEKKEKKNKREKSNSGSTPALIFTPVPSVASNARRLKCGLLLQCRVTIVTLIWIGLNNYANPNDIARFGDVDK